MELLMENYDRLMHKNYDTKYFIFANVALDGLEYAALPIGLRMERQEYLNDHNDDDGATLTDEIRQREMQGLYGVDVDVYRGNHNLKS